MNGRGSRASDTLLTPTRHRVPTRFVRTRDRPLRERRRAYGRDQRDPERKPRSVAADVIKQYAELLRSYDVHEIVSDNYAAGFSSDEWNRNGIGFRACDNDTAENFLRLLPLLTSKRARLADNATLRTQLSQLERRVVSGHEVVGHAQRAGAHDDVAAAGAGCLVEAAGHVSRLRAVHAGDGGADPEFPSTRDDGRPLVAVCVSTRREGPGPTKARDFITRVKLKTEN